MQTFSHPADKEITLQYQVEQFWEMRPSRFSLSLPSLEDKRALAILEGGTVKDQGHYKTA